MNEYLLGIYLPIAAWFLLFSLCSLGTEAMIKRETTEDKLKFIHYVGLSVCIAVFWPIFIFYAMFTTVALIRDAVFSGELDLKEMKRR